MADNESNKKVDNANEQANKKRLTLQERKDELVKKQKNDIAALNAKIRAQNARDAKKHKKLDDHYKIIEGALSRKNRLANPKSEQAKQMNRLFDEYVIKDDARIFFGFQPLPEKEKDKRIKAHKEERKKQKDMGSF